MLPEGPIDSLNSTAIAMPVSPINNLVVESKTDLNSSFASVNIRRNPMTKQHYLV